ncbi:hypothetical protein NC969_14970 [Leptolyngbya subtilissima ST-M1]|uniref:hypothetical protein n=1 Tax=Cyanophyceae TaxID=3028117 RepID=UPI0018EF8EFF
MARCDRPSSFSNRHTRLYLATITSFCIAIGALWEIAEWLAGRILLANVIGNVDDAVADMIIDTLGSGLAAIISLLTLQKWTDLSVGEEAIKDYLGHHKH